MELIILKQITTQPQAICGLPDAGTPLEPVLYAAMSRAWDRFKQTFAWSKNSQPHSFVKPTIEMKKETLPDGSRRISSASPPPRTPEDLKQDPMHVLLLDDVITRGETKFEAVDALRAQGWSVKDLLVIVDREQGGAPQLLVERGVDTHALYRVSDLIKFYAERSLIAPEMYDRVITYLHEQT